MKKTIISETQNNLNQLQSQINDLKIYTKNLNNRIEDLIEDKVRTDNLFIEQEKLIKKWRLKQ